MAGKLLLALLFLFLLTPASVFGAVTIENITPTEITSADQEIKLFVTASNLTSATQFLQVAITKQGSSNYFGLTQNNSGGWHSYDSTPDDLTTLLSFTPVDGSWNGEVNAKLDTSDTGFSGSGTYLIKLLKHITSTGSSSNQVPITVSIPSAAPIPSVVEGSRFPTPTPTQVDNSPSIQFSYPNNLKAGQEFEVTFTLSNFESGSYFVKTRIGKDSSHLTSGQTYNSEWLTDTDAWAKFPQVSGSGKVKARLSPNATVGDYKIKLSLKKGDDTPIQSEEKTLVFAENPNPPTTTSKTTPKAPTPTLIPTQKSGTVLAVSSSSATVEAMIQDHYKNIDMLATSSANKKSTLKKAQDLLIAVKSNEDFPVAGVVGILGFVMICVGGWFLLKGKFF